MGAGNSNASKFLSTLDVELGLTQEQLKETWNIYDKDRDGVLSTKEALEFFRAFAKAQGMSNVNAVSKAMLTRFDANGDGNIDFAELARVEDPAEGAAIVAKTTQLLTFPLPIPTHDQPDDPTQYLFLRGVNTQYEVPDEITLPTSSRLEVWMFSDGMSQNRTAGLIICGDATRWGLAVIEGKMCSSITDGETNDHWEVEDYSVANYPMGWHLLAVTDDETVRTFFRDGREIAQHTNTLKQTKVLTDVKVGRCGSMKTGDSHFRGLVASVTLWNCTGKPTTATFSAPLPTDIVWHLSLDARTLQANASQPLASACRTSEQYLRQVRQDVGLLAQCGQWQDMADVVLAGGNINRPSMGSHQRYSALHYAGWHDNTHMFSFLVQHGADTGIVDQHGKTPLHVAAKYGSPGCLRVLLLEGIDPGVQDDKGRTASSLVTTDLKSARSREVNETKLLEGAAVFRCWPKIQPALDDGPEKLKQLRAQAEESEDAMLVTEAEAYLAILGTSLGVPTGQDSDKDTPLPEVSTDIFISYCWQDKEVVRKLATHLRKQGLRVWLDLGQQEASELMRYIVAGINNCQLVLSCISPTYARSLDCRREMQLATSAGKPVLPVLVHPSSMEQWPPAGPMGPLLTGRLYVDLMQDHDVALKQVLQAVDKHVRHKQHQGTKSQLDEGEAWLRVLQANRPAVLGRGIELPESFALEIWVFCDGLPQNSQARIINFVLADQSIGWSLAVDNGRMCSILGDGEAMDKWEIEDYSIGNYPVGWHLLAVTDDGDVRTFYRDGQQVAEHSNTSKLHRSGLTIGMGALAKGCRTFRGLIAQPCLRRGTQVRVDACKGPPARCETEDVVWQPVLSQDKDCPPPQIFVEGVEWVTAARYMQQIKSDIGLFAQYGLWSEMTHEVLRGGGDVANVDKPSGDSHQGYSALHYAAWHDKPELFSFLVQHGANVHVIDQHGKTPLHVAAKYGSPGCLRVVLLEGVDPNSVDARGRTAMDMTAISQATSQFSQEVDETRRANCSKVLQLWPRIQDLLAEDPTALLNDEDAELVEEGSAYITLLQTGLNQQRSSVVADTLPGADSKDVFVSFCWKDHKAVARFVRQLRLRGVSVWFDLGQAAQGDLLGAIDAGIRNCKVVICCVSPAYGRSLNCGREVSLGSDLKKPFVPVIMEPCSWPPRGLMGPLLTGKAVIDLRKQGIDQVFIALSHSLPQLTPARSLALRKYVQFRGSHSHVDLSAEACDAAGGFVLPVTYTLKVWVFSDGLPQNVLAGIVACPLASKPGKDGWGLAVVDGKMCSFANDGATIDKWEVEAYSLVNYPVGWHLLVVKDDGGTRTFFRDGEQVAQHSNTLKQRVGSLKHLKVGQGNFNEKTTANCFFRGLVACVRLSAGVEGQTTEDLSPPLASEVSDRTLGSLSLQPDGVEHCQLLNAELCTVGEHMTQIYSDVGLLAQYGMWEDMADLVLAGGNTNRPSMGSHQNYSALHYAAWHDNARMFSFLVQHGANTGVVDQHGKTPLHVAAKYGSPACLRVLLLEGIDPNVLDDKGRTAGSLVTADLDSRSRDVDAIKLGQAADVFQCWPQIKQALDGETELKKLRVLAASQGDGALETEIVAFQAIVRPMSSLVGTSKLMLRMKLKFARKKKVDVFISYCWHDKDIVRPLADKLRAQNFNVWLDVGNMSPGDGLFEAIDSGIRDCKLVLSCISVPYCRSLNCLREMSLAKDVKKVVLPLLLEGAQWPPKGPMRPLLRDLTPTKVDGADLSTLLARLQQT